MVVCAYAPRNLLRPAVSVYSQIIRSFLFFPLLPPNPVQPTHLPERRPFAADKAWGAQGHQTMLLSNGLIGLASGVRRSSVDIGGDNPSGCKRKMGSQLAQEGQHRNVRQLKGRETKKANGWHSNQKHSSQLLLQLVAL